VLAAKLDRRQHLDVGFGQSFFLGEFTQAIRNVSGGRGEHLAAHQVSYSDPERLCDRVEGFRRGAPVAGIVLQCPQVAFADSGVFSELTEIEAALFAEASDPVTDADARCWPAGRWLVRRHGGALTGELA
jgi:hypothetical protein